LSQGLTKQGSHWTQRKKLVGVVGAVQFAKLTTDDFILAVLVYHSKGIELITQTSGGTEQWMYISLGP